MTATDIVETTVRGAPNWPVFIMFIIAAAICIAALVAVIVSMWESSQGKKARDSAKHPCCPKCGKSPAVQLFAAMDPAPTKPWHMIATCPQCKHEFVIGEMKPMRCIRESDDKPKE